MEDSIKYKKEIIWWKSLNPNEKIEYKVKYNLSSFNFFLLFLAHMNWYNENNRLSLSEMTLLSLNQRKEHDITYSNRSFGLLFE